MANTVVHFALHGAKTDSSIFHKASFDVPLSYEGILQMRQLGQTLISDNVVAIYTSPFKRTTDSAEILSDELGGIPVFVHEAITEANSTGTESLPRSALYGDYYKNAPEGVTLETPESIAKRVTDAVVDLRDVHEGKAFALMSHADPLAFGLWNLENPGKEIPSIVALHAEGYVLPKGGSWRVEVTPDLMVVRKNRIEGKTSRSNKEKA